jgi:hypothetical protein
MDEEAQFSYLRSLPLYDREVPYRRFTDGACNIVLHQASPQLVRDVRGNEKEFTLAQHGFEYRKHIVPTIDWQDEKAIRDVYIGDLEDLVRELVPEDVQRCELFDFRVGFERPTGLESLHTKQALDIDWLSTGPNHKSLRDRHP